MFRKWFKKPDITESGMFVQVRFYRREYALSNNKIKVLAGQNDRTIKSDGKINSSLHKEKVLEYLQQYDSITTVLAMQLLSLGKSRTAEILALMVANGVIIKKGVGRATCYCRAI